MEEKNEEQQGCDKDLAMLESLLHKRSFFNVLKSVKEHEEERYNSLLDMIKSLCEVKWMENSSVSKEDIYSETLEKIETEVKKRKVLEDKFYPKLEEFCNENDASSVSLNYPISIAKKFYNNDSTLIEISIPLDGSSINISKNGEDKVFFNSELLALWHDMYESKDELYLQKKESSKVVEVTDRIKPILAQARIRGFSYSEEIICFYEEANSSYVKRISFTKI